MEGWRLVETVGGEQHEDEATDDDEAYAFKGEEKADDATTTNRHKQPVTNRNQQQPTNINQPATTIKTIVQYTSHHH